MKPKKMETESKKQKGTIMAEAIPEMVEGDKEIVGEMIKSRCDRWRQQDGSY